MSPGHQPTGDAGSPSGRQAAPGALVRRFGRGGLRGAEYLVLACLGAADAGRLAAQTNDAYQILQTGGANSLVSQSVTLPEFTPLTAPTLHFEFGFSTAETPVARTFADSFGVSLEAGSGLLTFLVSVDASGVNWAPNTPGGLTLPSLALTYRSTPYPAGVPLLGTGVAFDVTVTVPSQFANQSLTMWFDMFDNLNGVQSVGFFRGVALTPEPSTWGLAVVGGAGLLLSHWARVRKSGAKL